MASLFPQASPPPESILVTDPEVWNRLTFEERRAHLQRIKDARLACRAYSAFTLRGNLNFLALSAIGGVISSLAPTQWPMMKRVAPFTILGLVGIWIDNAKITKQCEAKYPDPFTLQLTNSSPPADTLEAAGRNTAIITTPPSTSFAPSSPPQQQR